MLQCSNPCEMPHQCMQGAVWRAAKESYAPLDKDDKPELDDTPLLGPDGVKHFQMLIGATQWLIMLSRFDIVHAIICLGCFRAVYVKDIWNN